MTRIGYCVNIFSQLCISLVEIVAECLFCCPIFVKCSRSVVTVCDRSPSMDLRVVDEGVVAVSCKSLIFYYIKIKILTSSIDM